ncbi:endo alpha-1,4 polygalactosaminidase [Nocardiopsis sp. NPDC007018]|uniref:endo alpha-1,4 polygalactosaminidase n=1 Tax=Nocardiopsis sp. NPDC007018 TaxID=3155721 RepID=UPI0033E204E6
MTDGNNGTGDAVGGRGWCVVGLAVVLTGCGAQAGEVDAALPEGGFDYQLGGAYPPPEEATIVVRDSSAEPASGTYSVCYVNGFQTQPGEETAWLEDDLVLLDEDGAPVADPGWPDEMLLDTSTGEKRKRIARRLGETVDGCARAGFDAVEFDNLDSHLRSGGALTVDDNLALAVEIVALAHGSGLAAAQKNAAEEAERGRDKAGFDFAVTESCAAWSECSAYTDVYGPDGVLDIEYPEDLDAAGTSFGAVCDDPATPPRSLLRDLGLVPPDQPGHVYERCP